MMNNADYINNAVQQGVVCPTCGAINKQENMFCIMCGMKFNKNIIPPVQEPVNTPFTPAEEPAEVPVGATESIFVNAENTVAETPFEPVAEPTPVAESPFAPVTEPTPVAESPFAPVAESPFAPVAEAPVKPAENTNTAFAPVEKKVEEKTAPVEEIDAFAKGLPEWNIEPPQVPVRRR